MVVVATELDIDIECDKDGNFSARVNGEIVRFKNIAKVKEAIRRAAPTVDLVDLPDRGRGYYHETLAIQHVEVAVVEESYGKVFGKPSVSSSRYGGKVYYELHEPDATAEEELKAINLRYVEAVKALDTRYNADIFAVKGRMRRITPERFAELLAEKAATRDTVVQ